MDGSGTTRMLFRLLFVIAGVAAIAMLYLAKLLFLPLAFAILFAFLLAPLVAWLERIHLPRSLAALAVILGFAALLAVGGWFLFTQLVAIANDLPTYRENIDQKMAAIHSPSNSAFSRAQQEVERLSDQLGMANSTPTLPPPTNAAKSKPLGATPDRPVQVREVPRSPGRLDQLGGALEPLAIALLSVVFTFFVLLEREDLRNRLIRLSGDRNLALVTQAMDDASWRISRYVGLQLLVNLIYGAIIFAALYAMGLPHALLFGALGGLFRFVPYVGWWVAAALPTGLSLAVFQDWKHSLLIFGTFLCLEMLTGSYLEPRIYGRHTGLSPLAILVAASFWTLIWGPVGLLLSIPLTVCLVVMGRHIPSLEFLSVMLGDEPAMPGWTCLYQRLLARDEREAGDILQSYRSSKPLEDVYDSVLIPALVKSEEDRLQDELDESMVCSIRQTVRELILELGYRENRGAEQTMLEPITPPAATDEAGLRVMCVPVRDETDELAALMLAQSLEGGENRGHIRAFATGVQRLEETVATAEREKTDTIFLAGLPPFAIARCHRLYRTLRSRLPLPRIMIGIWNYPDNRAEAAQRIGNGDHVSVFTSLADAVAEVRSLANVGSEIHPAENESPADTEAAA